MAAKASAVSGMRVVYDKEGVDPCKCRAVYCRTLLPACFCHFVQDRGLPQASLADAHLKRQIMGRQAQPWWLR